MKFKVEKGNYGQYKVTGGMIGNKYYKVITTRTKSRAQEIAYARNRLVKKRSMK